jgi:hypothetical protein
MLAEEIEDSVRNVFVRHPDGGVFGHCELARENGYVDIGEVVRRSDRRRVDICFANSGYQ